jgi:phage gp29-like protein
MANSNKPSASVLLDHRGMPIARANLGRELASASVGSVRSPLSGYPSDGLNPLTLAAILREADAGSPTRYLELAEIIEERDPHYLGVLGTRRRSVSQIDITVEAGSESAEDEVIAQMLRDWLKRDELTDEVFAILDCIGKGYSATEIIWDTSERQWMPNRLEWRDPRWFRFDRRDLTTPMMLSETGGEQPLEPFKFIFASIKAKSGLPLRSGLARVAMWGYLFKAYTLRDWAIFTQTYGQPVRVGKFDSNATPEDKATLFRAVANIAGDCAAIIPASMEIEFIEASNVGASSDLYEKRADWFDRQISKAVLGQTSTTDAEIGGLGSGKEHREVQEVIEKSDARALAAILNRDLVQPWVQLNYGPRKSYPRLVIARKEQEDLKAFSDAITPLIDRGLEVEQATIQKRFGLPDVTKGAKLLQPQRAGAMVTAPPASNSKIKGNPGEIKRVKPFAGTSTALQAEGALAGENQGVSPEDMLTDQMQQDAAPALQAMLSRMEAMIQAATSLEELRAMISEGFDGIATDQLSQALAAGFLTAHLAGRADLAEDSD